MKVSLLVVYIAQHKALRRHLGESGEGEEGEGVVVRYEDVRSALREVRPSAMREVTLEVPKVSEMSLFQIVISECALFVCPGVVGRYRRSGGGEEETERGSGVATQTPRGSFSHLHTHSFSLHSP